MDWISSLSARWKGITELNFTNSPWWLFDVSVAIKDAYNIQNSIASVWALMGCILFFPETQKLQKYHILFPQDHCSDSVHVQFITFESNSINWVRHFECTVRFCIQSTVSSFLVLSLLCCTASSCLHKENSFLPNYFSSLWRRWNMSAPQRSMQTELMAVKQRASTARHFPVTESGHLHCTRPLTIDSFALSVHGNSENVSKIPESTMCLSLFCSLK